MPASPEQRMAVAAARMLVGHTTCFVGIGVPSIAAMLAKRLHERTLNLIYESGVIGADPSVPPLSTGSPSVAKGADMVGRMIDVFGALQAGRIDIGLLSGAQVDREGNLNSTTIGSYEQPVRRLPGSGGALDIALLARELLILMPHEPRRLVERVDFITSPGRAHAARRGAGGRASAIVTDKAKFLFGRNGVELAGYFEDVDPGALSAFDGVPPHADPMEIMPLPTAQELATLMSFSGNGS